MKSFLRLLLPAFFALGANAQIPERITYQGALSLDGSTPANGVVAMTFSFYANQSSTDILWTENQNVDVYKGAFTVFLGAVNPFSSAGLAFTRGLWLETTIYNNNTPEVLPRIALSSSPFSFHARTADSILGGTVRSLNSFKDSVTIVGGNNISISSSENATGGVITISAVDALSTGDITSVQTPTGSGLSGGAMNGDATLSIAAGGVMRPMVAAGQLVKSLNGLTDSLTLKAGSNISVSSSGNSLTISAPTMGDITGVSAGIGLSGGGTSGSVTLNITTSGITSSMIQSSAAVKSLNSLTGAVNITAGSGITVTPTGSSIRISSGSTGTNSPAGGDLAGIYPDPTIASTASAGNDILAALSVATTGTIPAALIASGLSDAQITDSLTIAGGTINNTPIGAATPSSGIFTTLSASGAATFSNAVVTTALSVGGTLNVDGALSASSFSGDASALGNIHADSISQGILSVAHGGMGTSSLAMNAVVIGNGANAVTTTNVGGINTVLHGTGSMPAFGKIVMGDLDTGMYGAGGSSSGNKLLQLNSSGFIDPSLLPARDAVRKINNITDSVTLQAGSNVLITQSGKTITIHSTAGSGGTGAPPSGPAGGDLTGGYPDPYIAQSAGNSIADALNNAATTTAIDASVLTGNASITISGNATNVTGIVSVANGGTGQNIFNDGELLIGSSTGNSLSKNTLSGTTNQIIITNGPGTVTLHTPQDIGTTSSPTFAAVAATNFSGNGSALTALVPGNIVNGTANISVTGTALNVTGTVTVANGGTGITSLPVNGVLYGGSSTVGVTAAGSTNTLLHGVSSGVPAFSDVSFNDLSSSVYGSGGTGSENKLLQLGTSGYISGTALNMQSPAIADFTTTDATSGTFEVVPGGTISVGAGTWLVSFRATTTITTASLSLDETGDTTPDEVISTGSKNYGAMIPFVTSSAATIRLLVDNGSTTNRTFSNIHLVAVRVGN